MENEKDILQEEFEQVEKFLLQKMSAEERKTFEQKLVNDADLQQTLNETRLLILGAEEAVLFDKMQDFHKELPAKHHRPAKYFSLQKLFLAAAVLIAVVIGSWLLFFNKDTNDQLFAAYYSPDPGLITAMGVSDNYEFDKAMIEYKTGEYSKALEAWQRLLKSNPTNDTLHYFIASSYVALNQPQNAITHFDSVINAGKSYFKQDALWYLGLVFLKLGDTKQAALYIGQSNNPQKEELLAKMLKNKM